MNKLIATIVVVLGLLSTASAQTTYTWNGGAGNGNWNVAGNWDGGLLPVSGTNTIIELNNTTQTTTNQNITAPFVLNQLNMLVDATDGFVVTGNPLQFAGSGAQISNAAAATLRINTAIDFATNTTFDLTANNVSGRELQLTGPLTAASGTTVAVTSTNGTPNTITLLQGTNSGFLGTLSITNNSIVHTTGQNTLARSATISTTGAQSSYIVGTLAASGLTPTGAVTQLGAVTGSGQFSVGDASITSTALIGFNNNALDTSTGTLAAGNTNSHIGKVGTGEWRFTGTTNNTVNGGFSVRDGLMHFQNSSSSNGGFGTTSNGLISIYAGSEFRASLTGTGSNGRIGNNQPVILSGGVLRYNLSGMGTSSSGYSEAAGQLTAGAGQSIIQIDVAANRGGRLSFTSLGTPNLTGSLVFLSNNLGNLALNSAGSGNVNFTTAPTAQLVGSTTTYGADTQNLSILPYGTAGTTTDGIPSTFVTFDAANASIRRLENSNYADSLGGIATNNVSLSNSTTVNTATINNALRLTSGGSVNNSSTLTLTAGALLNNGGGDISGSGTLSFGDAGNRTAFITTNNAMTIANSISALNLSKNGAGTLSLTGNTTLTGTTGNTVAVNAGTLNLSSGSSVTTSTALSATNTLTYQISRGATLDVSANGLDIGQFTTLTGGAATNATGIANQARVVGNVSVNSGGTIAPSSLGGSQANLASPGTLSIDGNLSLSGGSSYLWYFNSAITNGDNTVNPTAETLANFRSPYTSSVISISGTLDLTQASADNRIVLKLSPLSLANGTGNIYDLIEEGSPGAVQRTWMFLEASSINGFSADKFTIDTSDLNFSDQHRTFVLWEVNNTLLLTYIVPEPAGIVAVCGVVLLIVAAVRKKRQFLTTLRCSA